MVGQFVGALTQCHDELVGRRGRRVWLVAREAMQLCAVDSQGPGKRPQVAAPRRPVAAFPARDRLLAHPDSAGEQGLVKAELLAASPDELAQRGRHLSCIPSPSPEGDHLTKVRGVCPPMRRGIMSPSVG